MKVNKSDLVAEVSAVTDLPIAEVERVVDAFLAALEAAVLAGTPVAIHKFGKFVPKTRAATARSHPGTGKRIEVPPKRRLAFQISETLDARMNNGAQGD